MLEITDGSKSFKSGSVTTTALASLTLKVQGGEFVALVGRSGSGKTTALNVLSGRTKLDSGSACVMNNDMAALSEVQLRALRRSSVAQIAQDFDLFDELTANENVELALRLREQNFKDVKAAATSALSSYGLENRINHLPSQLSGGEKQRVAIARAMASQFPIILADEPTGSLDETNAQTVARALQIAAQNGAAVLAATHDPIVFEMADRIVYLGK